MTVRGDGSRHSEEIVKKLKLCLSMDYYYYYFGRSQDVRELAPFSPSSSSCFWFSDSMAKVPPSWHVEDWPRFPGIWSFVVQGRNVCSLNVLLVSV